MRLWRRRHRHRHDDPLVCQEFVELVTDYLEGTLPARERARFEAHLAECDGCAGYLADIRSVSVSLHEAPAPPPDPATREVLLRAFRELRGSSS
jgi:anti-sigma factor RsiW